jgi:predicted TIM-barrel fold metal-dependent hydrolase
MAVFVDVHAHAVIPHYQRLLADAGVAIPGYGKTGPGLVGDDDAVTDSDDAIARRITMMDQADVGRQLLSAMFAPYLVDETSAVRAARCVNDAHADMAAKRPDRLAAYAALPLPHVEASLAELRRCLDDLGMIGVALQCSCFDESVAAERFEAIYEELHRQKAVVFFHPCVNGLCSPLISQWGLAPTAGAVFEDTTIALHLILRRIPERFPDITFIVPHLGGALPMLLNRLDNQLPLSAPGLPEKPSATARRFFYDTVGHGSAAALRCAVDALGADRVLPGSDYPVLLAFESYRDTFAYLTSAGLDEAVLDRILTSNAAQVFPTLRSAPTPDTKEF